jgi:hypothetical protein
MAILKDVSTPKDNPEPNTGRRSFIWKTGAAMSAVVASAIAGDSPSRSDSDTSLEDRVGYLSNRVGSLEDANAIRRLHQAFEFGLDQGRYEEAVGVFTNDAQVVYNGGVFSGEAGIRRLLCDHFASGGTGKSIKPAPGFATDPAQQLDLVEVGMDRKTASGQFPYSMQAGKPMTGESSLVQMARLQGEGLIHWWESGIHRVSFVKMDGEWKICRLEYLVASTADYRPGRRHAKPISVASFSETYPGLATGPDKLVRA